MAHTAKRHCGNRVQTEIQPASEFREISNVSYLSDPSCKWKVWDKISSDSNGRQVFLYNKFSTSGTVRGECCLCLRAVLMIYYKLLKKCVKWGKKGNKLGAYDINRTWVHNFLNCKSIMSSKPNPNKTKNTFPFLFYNIIITVSEEIPELYRYLTGTSGGQTAVKIGKIYSWSSSWAEYWFMNRT